MTLLEIILTFALVVAIILALRMNEKIRDLNRQLQNSDCILQDITTENGRLKKIKRSFERTCLHEQGEWIIVDTNRSFLVCKTTQNDNEITLIARSYKYNTEDTDDRDYALNCAEELLEKLTEKV